MADIAKELRSLLDSCVACGPAREDQIEAAQRKLGLLFPPSYRLFLETYGAVFGPNLNVAGLTPDIGDDPPMWSGLLDETFMCRRYNALPDDSIYISTDGTDLTYFLRCSRDDPSLEGAVIEWGPDHHGGIPYAENFISFLARRADR
jgi:hypothetical protein